jgi:hypothetical protein
LKAFEKLMGEDMVQATKLFAKGFSKADLEKLGNTNKIAFE